MAWYVYVAYFFGGVFLTNAVPHFVQGVSGQRFQSPFANPPGVGESSPVVNVTWGFANLVAGYALIFGVGDFAAGLNVHGLSVGAGMFVMGLFCARHFGRVRGAAR